MNWRKVFFWRRDSDWQVRQKDLDRELRAHLELEAEEQQESGLPEEVARHAARRAFGNVTLVHEEIRAMSIPLWLEQLLQDLRFGLRMLRKSPGFSAVAVLTLALGIGANTAIFSVINGVLLSPLPYNRPDEIVVKKENESLLNVMEIQRRATSFSVGGAINAQPIDYTGGPEPLQIQAGVVDSGFFEVLGVPPMMGRVISAAEDVRGGPRVAVVSYSFWRSYLGSDPQAVGQTIASQRKSVRRDRRDAQKFCSAKGACRRFCFAVGGISGRRHIARFAFHA